MSCFEKGFIYSFFWYQENSLIKSMYIEIDEYSEYYNTEIQSFIDKNYPELDIIFKQVDRITVGRKPINTNTNSM